MVVAHYTPNEMAKRMLPKSTGTVSVREDTGSLIMNAGNVEVTINKKTGLLVSAKNSKGILSLKNGPVLLIPGSGTSTGNNPVTGSSGPGSGGTGGTGTGGIGTATNDAVGDSTIEISISATEYTRRCPD